MFETSALRQATFRAMVAALLLVGGLCAAGGIARAQAPTEPREAGALVEAMQARADGLSGLSGLLGTARSAPVQGQWSGVPFVFRAPDCYARKDGYAVDSVKEAPVKKDDAWCIYKEGWLYVRPRAVTLRGSGGDPAHRFHQPRLRTRKMRPGYATVSHDHRRDFERAVCGGDSDVLLMVNLMPRSWFVEAMDRLRAGPIEELAGKSYYTIIEVPPLPEGDDQSRTARPPWRPPAPRKYYVNRETLVCERVLWGSAGKDDPFEGAGRDSVASDVQKVGGVLLPTTYALRTFGRSGVHLALETRLRDLEVKDAGEIADAEFDAYGLYPDPFPVIWQPMADPEQLAEQLKQQPNDAGAWLSLADAHYLGGQYEQAQAAMQRCDELFGGKGCEEYAFQRGWLMTLLMPNLRRQQGDNAGE